MSTLPLPDELVAETLQYLPYTSLWSAASVSQQFYTAAWSVGLYIPTTLDCTDRARTELDIDAQLKRFNQVLGHVLRKDLRLRLTLVFPTRRQGTYPPSVLAAVPEILLALTASLPVLVALSICIPDGLSVQLSVALQHPAPHLRSLVLSGFHLDSYLGQAAICPAEFLGGYAPRLCELELSSTTLGQERIPAFSNVLRLNLYNDTSTTRLSQHFPRLAIVDIFQPEAPSIPPITIDCARAAVRRLVFHDYRLEADPSNPLCLKLSNTPEFHYLCEYENGMDWEHPLGWRADGGPLSVRLCTDVLRSDSNVAVVTVVSGDRSWCRSYSIDAYTAEPRIELDRMPGLTQCLGYLRIEAHYLSCFLQGAASYPVLRCIRVDVCETYRDPRDLCPVEALFHEFYRGKRWKQEATGERVRCPALEILSLFATAPIATAPTAKELTESSERRTNVRYADVARVRHALSPLADPVLELVAINVVDCRYDAETDYTEEPVLSRLFSSIRQRPFPGQLAGAHLDDGLWGEQLHVMSDSSCLPSRARDGPRRQRVASPRPHRRSSARADIVRIMLLVL